MLMFVVCIQRGIWKGCRVKTEQGYKVELYQTKARWWGEDKGMEKGRSKFKRSDDAEALC